MNTLLAILKVADSRRDVIVTGGLYHRFPWRHLPPPPPGEVVMQDYYLLLDEIFKVQMGCYPSIKSVLKEDYFCSKVLDERAPVYPSEKLL